MDRNLRSGPVSLIDQGGDLPMGGLRRGAGARHPSGLLLRAEIEGSLGDGRSQVNTAGAFESLRIDSGLAAYGVVGFQGPSGSAIFARAGLQGWQASRHRAGLPESRG